MKPNQYAIDPVIVKTINKLNKLSFIKRTLFSCAAVGPRPKSQSKDGYGKNHWPDVNESFKHGQIAYTPYIAFQTHEKPTSFAKRQMKSFLTKLSKIALVEEWTDRYKNGYTVYPGSYSFKDEIDVYVWWNKINKLINETNR